MILLFTDFGVDGPYVGQMHVVLAREAPGVPVIDLMHDAPAHDPRAAAYLLAALAESFDANTVCVAVVDPGVGGPRPPVVLETDSCRFVGPGNGLFELVRRRARHARRWRIDWRPDRLSASFHGRDLFAPVAAMLARGEAPPGAPMEGGEPVSSSPESGWPDDLAEIVHVDRFGNLMTGRRASSPRRPPARRSGTPIPAVWWRSPSTAPAPRTGSASRSATRCRPARAPESSSGRHGVSPSRRVAGCG